MSRARVRNQEALTMKASSGTVREGIKSLTGVARMEQEGGSRIKRKWILRILRKEIHWKKKELLLEPISLMGMLSQNQINLKKPLRRNPLRNLVVRRSGQLVQELEKSSAEPCSTKGRTI